MEDAVDFREIERIAKATYLTNLRATEKAFSDVARSVIALTGKTALRAFKTSLNIFEFLIENIIAFGAWLLGLFGLGAGRRILRAVRHQGYARHRRATFDQASNRQDVSRERR